MASNVPVKKSRLGKNKKKAWKAIDITEVEDVLEDERMQERTGGLVAEKSDDQLFMVDKDAFDPKENDSKYEKRKRKRALKCHSNLEPDPNIKPISISHNVRKVQPEVERLSRRIKSGKKTLTEIKAEKQRKVRNKQRAEARRNKNKTPVADFDLWETDVNADISKEDPHFCVVTKKRRINVPRHYHQKPSEMSSIQVPDPGASYNPSYDDHQNLLAKAHDVEVKREKKEKKLYNAVEAKFRTISAAELEENLRAEMTSGLNEEEDEKVEFTEEELEKLSVAPPVRREDKKTKVQRNKEKNVKEKEHSKLKDKTAKSREKDIFRLKTIKAEIKTRERDLSERARQKKEKYNKSGMNTRKLGKMKFEEANIEIKLSDELPGALRLLKPEGHLMVDRFKSLQKRNVIEPRLEASKKQKYKPKTFMKKGYETEEEMQKR
ncbi:ribosome biogenesis protein NOP53-like [Ylistrum balloti]|uniref:ribosome biogenesis protein NOP53-like n=1 Tax=Ylistrum balloti TaxID=509963 RepID=UPI002905A571|nr:ribosome biogenesis protein NOP53-like [Ylistrum balloti]